MRGLALLPALLLFVSALASLSSLSSASDSPKPEHWNAAAAYLKQAREQVAFPDGDLIVFAPQWMDPVGRQYVGEQMDVAMVARMDAARYGRIWELSFGGAHAPEVLGLHLESTKNFGPLTLGEYTQTPAILSEDFTAAWKRAKVSGPIQGRPKLSLEEVGFQPHRCIKVIPQPNQTVSLDFGSVSLGTRIVGYVGLADVFTRRDVRAPGQLELWIDGNQAAQVRAGVDDGWKRFEVQTNVGQGKVEFRLSALGAQARDRRICFAAEARR